MSESCGENLLGEFRLPSSDSSIMVGGAAVAEILKAEGFRPEVVCRGRLALEEALSNVVRHAYTAEQNSDIHVYCRVISGGVSLRVRDHGIPFDANKSSRAHHGLDVMRTLVDRVSVRSLGRAGKEVELVVLRRQDSDSLGPDSEPEHTLDKIETRLMEDADTVEVCQCLYRSYGYSYLSDELYDPERFNEMRHSGHIDSMVVEDESTQTIVGHAALVLDKPDDEIAEMGLVFVDPRYRGSHAAQTLGVELFRRGAERGLKGLYALVTAAHPYAQRAARRQGGFPCGVLLGCETADVDYRKTGERIKQRSSEVLFYHLLHKPKEEAPCYPPPKHAEVVSKVFGWLSLPHRFEAPEVIDKAPGDSVLETTTFESAHSLLMNFERIGKDAPDLLAEALKKIRTFRLDVAYLYLPLTQPQCGPFAELAEQQGFSFAGVMPYWKGGHALVLQFLNFIEMRKDGVQTDGEETAWLLDYVWNCYQSSETFL